MGRSPTNTKEKLLATANDLIWQSSYGSVSVDDICKAADVKKGSFYYYFPSKSELAVAVMEQSYLEFEAGMISIFSTDVSPVLAFEQLVIMTYEKQAEALNKYGRVCGCPFTSLGSEMVGKEEIIQKKADDIFNRQAAIFAKPIQRMVELKMLSQDTDISAMASQLLAFILGQLVMARIQNDITSLKEDLLIGLFRTLNIKRSEVLL
mgnify:CR=1 FL=1